MIGGGARGVVQTFFTHASLAPHSHSASDAYADTYTCTLY